MEKVVITSFNPWIPIGQVWYLGIRYSTSSHYLHSKVGKGGAVLIMFDNYYMLLKDFFKEGEDDKNNPVPLQA